MNPRSPSAARVCLAGLRVLVVEDDYFIADELCGVLRNHGAEVLGPLPDIERCVSLIETKRIDCAILDINLKGRLSFGLAGELRCRGIPVIFSTGYPHSMLPGSFSGHVRLEKPVDLNVLLQAVRSSCGPLT